jgi:hypothetical protein
VDVIVMLLLCAAVALALLEGFGVAARVNLGWLALACFAAAFAIPAIKVVTSS